MHHSTQPTIDNGKRITKRERDSGLQPERTCLAWSRTAFAMLVLACLMLKNADTTTHLLWYPLGVAMLLASLITYIYSRCRAPYLSTTGDLVTQHSCLAKGVLSLFAAATALALMIYFLFQIFDK